MIQVFLRWFDTIIDFFCGQYYSLLMSLKHLFVACLAAVFYAAAAQNCSALKNAGIVLMKASADERPVQLMAGYDVKFHHLDLKIERTSAFVAGSVRTIAQAVAAMDSFVFELHPNLQIDSIIAGGSDLVAARDSHYVFVHLPQVIEPDSALDIRIYYHGFPPTASSGALGGGFTNAASPTWGNQVTWSLSQPYSAYEWWPCKQALQDKIDSVYIFITTDSSNKAGSNGTLVNTVSLPAGKTRYEWKEIYPIDYYLISVAVAQYVDYRFYAYPGNTPPVLVQNYIYNNPATLSQFKPFIDKTKDFIELFSGLYGPYPFYRDKYGHAMAPISGGMEHQTMTTIGFFDFTTTAHELTHQWFGDEVTCATWSDIWLNEGFASYGEYLALEYLNPSAAQPHMQSFHSDVTNQPNGSIWFTDTSNVSRIFSSRLTYEKAASFIHMIRYRVGDTLFFSVLKEYIKRFGRSTASTIQFKKVLEDLTGQDFTAFFNQWFYGEGYPFFNVTWNQWYNRVTLKCTEQPSAPASVPLFITPVQYRISTDKGDTIVQLTQDSLTRIFQVFVNGTVNYISVDPASWLLCTSRVTKDLALPASGSGQLTTFQISPNPAENSFTISMDARSFRSLQLFDLQGREVINSGHYEQVFNCSALSPGLYMVAVTTVSGVEVQKLLIR
jgi:aminopeptidase N